MSAPFTAWKSEKRLHHHLEWEHYNQRELWSGLPLLPVLLSSGWGHCSLTPHLTLPTQEVSRSSPSESDRGAGRATKAHWPQGEAGGPLKPDLTELAGWVGVEMRLSQQKYLLTKQEITTQPWALWGSTLEYLGQNPFKQNQTAPTQEPWWAQGNSSHLRITRSHKPRCHLRKKKGEK